ncbi:SDR family NAD(P)-dependent oxidoreductase [Bacteroides fragilis]|nr:SDR family oxidoreductase [Bacteroides fragilis]EFR55267.1 oxidoreductase, short chain dehydrogenase/reductase family protein [Bacteroides fragilis 3_1_12]MBM6512900.1 SDR family oxidoreductase [Bacteroides fragilis]QKH86385.1 SDR family oxidoreductase [Bacteroides fragilis]
MDIFNPFTLKGKTILVTGASSGIGRGIAIACSKMGASVIINGRNEQRLAETLREMRGEENLSLIADLSQTDAVAIMVRQLPKLDGVVHCAGIGQRILCKQLQESDLDNMMDVNFKAPVMFQTELLRQKKINKGASIVFIASIAYDSPTIGNAMYCASKGAVISYANCLALELAPRLIRVNCILPAMIWTDLIYKGGITEEELKEDEKKYPLKRYGKPEDVANLSVYLLSDASAWMTGSSIKLTGGISK